MTVAKPAGDVLSDSWFHSLGTSTRSYTPAPKQSSRQNDQWRSNLRPGRQPQGGLFDFFDWDEDEEERYEPPKPRLSLYKTVCVRMCDGFYFPISFATTKDRFRADEAKCKSSCSSPARLFVYLNPGETPEQMVDLKGNPYAKTSSAFLYRTSYQSGCTCRPHPWQAEAKAKHAVYALQAAKRKGDKKAAATLAQMRKDARQAARDERTAALAARKAARLAKKNPTKAVAEKTVVSTLQPASAEAETASATAPTTAPPKQTAKIEPAGRMSLGRTTTAAAEKSRRQARSRPSPNRTASRRPSRSTFSHRLFEE